MQEAKKKNSAGQRGGGPEKRPIPHEERERRPIVARKLVGVCRRPDGQSAAQAPKSDVAEKHSVAAVVESVQQRIAHKQALRHAAGAGPRIESRKVSRPRGWETPPGSAPRQEGPVGYIHP